MASAPICCRPVLLEVDRGIPWKLEIDRAFHVGDEQPLVAVRPVGIPGLGQHRAAAVRHTVLAQVSGPQLGVTDFMEPIAGSRPRPPATIHSAADTPCRARSAGGCRPAELEQPGLYPVVGLQLERLVVEPRDAQPVGPRIRPAPRRPGIAGRPLRLSQDPRPARRAALRRSAECPVRHPSPA